jgi:hypothetical protein
MLEKVATPSPMHIGSPGSYSPLFMLAPHMTELLQSPVAPHITELLQIAEKPPDVLAPHITEEPPRMEVLHAPLPSELNR